MFDLFEDTRPGFREVLIGFDEGFELGFVDSVFLEEGGACLDQAVWMFGVAFVQAEGVGQKVGELRFGQYGFGLVIAAGKKEGQEEEEGRGFHGLGSWKCKTGDPDRRYLCVRLGSS